MKQPLWACRAAALGLLMLACAPVQGAAPEAEVARTEYRVGPGDLLKVSVYRSPDLDTNVRVTEGGSVAIGSIGSLVVNGLTPAEIGQRIAAKLKSAGILLDPTVNVLVSEYHSKTVSVLGSIGKPGEYPLDRSGLSLTEVLARAGANLDNGAAIVTVTSPGEGEPQRVRLADLVSGGRDRPARAGESIFVQSAPLFYVSGEVQRAGGYPLQPGMTVGQAVAVAGGVTPRGSPSRLKVTHAGEPGSPHKAKASEAVQPNDLIVVGPRIF
jgi:polysaccharide export outer membrane protein